MSDFGYFAGFSNVQSYNVGSLAPRVATRFLCATLNTDKSCERWTDFCRTNM